MNYIVGGKLGDLIHALWVVRRNYEVRGAKGYLYITNDLRYGGDYFSRPVTETIEEVRDILKYQPYIASVELLDGHIIDSTWINLNDWRQNITSSHWFRILSSTYSLPLPTSVKQWLEFPRVNDSKWSQYVVIHRSCERHNPHFPWDQITLHYKCLFVTCKPHEYEIFPWRDRVEMYVPKDLHEMTDIIANAGYYIGNMSSPLAIAVALGRPCLAELNLDEARFYLNTGMCEGKMLSYVNPIIHDMLGLENILSSLRRT